MGAAVGEQAVAAGAQGFWLPAGRGPATQQRATAAGLTGVADMAVLAASCSLIVSVCPPAAAVEVASLVAGSGFTGVYLEANAISPARAQYIAGLLGERGVTTVDGGIVGPPPRRPGATRLYLSGPEPAVQRVRELFAGSWLAPVVLSGPVGRASALKLAFAAYNKLSYVLAAQAYALASGYAVVDELTELAKETLPDTPFGQPDRLASAAARAWRWEPEFREIADACAAAGLPTDLVAAAGAMLERWKDHKDADSTTLDELIADLTDVPPDPDASH
jgi:3-hydroxyisobutyrate dehydrogenase-like beta-hydroxyacid dehydrogenase